MISFEQLYPHQKQFLQENPNCGLLAYETGTGKTDTALHWMLKRPGVQFLIVVPKNIKKKWQLETTHDVVTKEEFKKITDFSKYSGVVVDEADFFASPLFTQGRSQMTEKMYNFTKKLPYILLLTATPYRNNPHSIHSLLTYIKLAPDWKKWRNDMYQLVTRPYNPRPFWEAQKEWRIKAVKYATPLIYTAKMSDIVTVPKQHHTKYSIATSLPTELTSTSLVGEWHEYARRESGREKLEWIKEFIKDKSKVLICCRYKEQMAFYAKNIDRQVYMLSGDTKDFEAVVIAIQNDPDCIVLLQHEVGAGFELPDISWCIFANLPFSHRSYVQCRGRIHRINKLKENWYIYLNGGDCDNGVYRSIIEMEKDYEPPKNIAQKGKLPYQESPDPFE